MKTIKGYAFDIFTLRTGDRVDCAGGRFDPVSVTIRGYSAGWRRAFDYKRVAAHTGTVLVVNDYPMLLEMVYGPGTAYDCRIAPLYERDGRIIAVWRYKAMESAQNRSELAKQLTKDANTALPYGTGDLLQWLNNRFKDDPDKWYCSEHHAGRLENYVLEFKRYGKVSPFRLQKFSAGSASDSYRVA